MLTFWGQSVRGRSRGQRREATRCSSGCARSRCRRADPGGWDGSTTAMSLCEASGSGPVADVLQSIGAELDVLEADRRSLSGRGLGQYADLDRSIFGDVQRKVPQQVPRLARV